MRVWKSLPQRQESPQAHSAAELALQQEEGLAQPVIVMVVLVLSGMRDEVVVGMLSWHLRYLGVRWLRWL